MTAAAPPSAPPSLPILYARPRALNVTDHGALSLRPDRTFRFAAATHCVPVAVAEFFQAQRDYPLVFTNEDLPLPLAVLGLRSNENYFVDGAGTWRAAAYVPGYVRRYPFIFAEIPGSSDLTLCIDEGAEVIETSLRQPLFKDGQPTDLTRKAMEFCVAYQRDYQATRQFCEALKKADLLVVRDAQVRVSQSNNVLLQGFRIVDEQRFNALPAETFLEWRGKGWIAFVYAHLLSLGAWDRLALLAASR